MEGLEPPEIAVGGVGVDPGVRGGGSGNPGRADQLLAIGAAVLPAELGELEEIEAGEAKAAAGLREAEGRVDPFCVGDAEGMEELCLGEGVGGLADGVVECLAEKEGAGGAVAEAAVEG